ncbi:MAG TPA: hypothetical protein VH054_19660 [Polyangiaceae bacterium]|jgi:hypothetical protein|nr:hypothetical protein [Polyangiaceae bacterium]
MKRWLTILAVVVGLALVGVGLWFAFRAGPRAVGVPCSLTSADVDSESDTYAGCNGGLCIRENDETNYCTVECKTDDACPSGYVCEPTRSRRRRACMEEGADITPADAGAADGAVVHVFRRKR